MFSVLAGSSSLELLLGCKNKTITKQRKESKKNPKQKNQPTQKPQPEKAKSLTLIEDTLLSLKRKLQGQSLEKRTQLCNLIILILLLNIFSSMKKAERCEEHTHYSFH